jgi:hypothetical protein
MLSNLGNWGMAAEDGPWLVARSTCQCSSRVTICTMNGMCARPVALDCSFESACEHCNFFETGPQFIPILRRQRDHAVEQDQAARVELFEGLIKDIDGAT